MAGIDPVTGERAHEDQSHAQILSLEKRVLPTRILPGRSRGLRASRDTGKHGGENAGKTVGESLKKPLTPIGGNHTS